MKTALSVKTDLSDQSPIPTDADKHEVTGWRRQLSAVGWIVVAWLVGTLIFEMSASGAGAGQFSNRGQRTEAVTFSASQFTPLDSKAPQRRPAGR